VLISVASINRPDGMACGVSKVPILLQKWEMRESKRRLGVEARFWLPLAPLGAVASKQLH